MGLAFGRYDRAIGCFGQQEILCIYAQRTPARSLKDAQKSAGDNGPSGYLIHARKRRAAGERKALWKKIQAGFIFEIFFTKP